MSDAEKVMRNAFGSGHDLYLDEFYYISYSDQKELLTQEEQKKRFGKYLSIMRWPDSSLKYRSIAELHPEENPNYIKITGRMILEWAEKGYIPLFDTYFKKTHRLIMVPVEAWEHFNKLSIMLRKRRKRK